MKLETPPLLLLQVTFGDNDYYPTRRQDIIRRRDSIENMLADYHDLLNDTWRVECPCGEWFIPRSRDGVLLRVEKLTSEESALDVFLASCEAPYPEPMCDHWSFTTDLWRYAHNVGAIYRVEEV
ncbi:hypothetical protein QNA24_29945 [Rhodococcus qingshengii]|uniref:hypothetical protein n=1 Tax=Rhodococcus TaxID=1827 RepID=UPI001E4DDB64|nr:MULTISPECIES: hypothetical protein [Rhodococcus]MCD2099592.1 hypothetical protein [Rhodococcus rhodochrous]MCD2123960.1 hypothetical protein [Rhodococcus rhodochrous]MCQ4136609.1 hypothetical protein [Rhodococcus rhodochrous]MDJ0490606.1 hypothetical protein [Rhodococcus qingshengii]